MREFLYNFKDKITEIYSRLELRQKIVLGGLLVLTIGVFIWLIGWSSREDYSLLFGNMEPEDASKAINKLNDLAIPYKLTNNGRTILIPKAQVYETRIQLSTEGIGTQTGTGFEIFDKSSLGMTEKVQKINYQRAMEGELQRTIKAIDGIEYVRIHLVFPEDKLFKEDQQDPSASVLLRLKKKLTQNQIDGITNLIASAVEGLDATQVTVTDQEGNVLTKNYNDSVSGLSNAQLDLQRDVEKELRNRVQSMLNNLLEPGNSDVRIAAELNFDKIETTLEQYDPESKVTRSEEIESSSSLMEADSISESSEHLITNYEINQTIQHLTKQVGNIKRLTVSVNINYRKTIAEEEGKTVKRYEARTQAELAMIESAVRNAVGFDENRGDGISVSSFRFEDSESEWYRLQQEKTEDRRQLMDMIEKGGVLLVLLVLMFTFISQLRKIFAKPAEEEELPEGIRPVLAEGEAEDEGFYPEGEEGMPMGEGKISYSFKPMKDIEIEQTETQLMQEAVKNFILENPDTALKLIKSWMIDKAGR